ncbi:MAG: fimbrillin family protein [Bacteroidales bacterium]|nr:fimbrillin family protein [Bacteroidales bacterium]
MNTKYFFIIFAASILAACSQLEDPGRSSVPVALSYSTVAATETKAAQNLNEGTFASGESVTVRISNTGEGSWMDYDFTTGSAGAMSPTSTVPYYPAGAQNIDIVAYYPATAGTSFSVATNQTTDASYKASDLMFASVSNQAKTTETVNLAFAHKMAKLCVNITVGDGVSSVTDVSILNVKPTVSFNQATGEVGTAVGSAASIAISNNGAAVIPAQTIDGGLLSIVTDKGTATYSVASKAFVAGQLYTLNITVNLRAVGTTTAITGWTSEGTVTVNPVVTSKIPAGLAAVDLGLTSGVKWANMNVGAESETDYGTYFAWGETYGYTVVGSTSTAAAGNLKTTFNWSTYLLCNGDALSMNRYCDESTYGAAYGSFRFYDHITTLEPAFDAASVGWGGNWRMPTKSEIEALVATKDDTDNYTWTWCNGTTEKYNGTTVKGWKIESKKSGTAGNHIFLPAAGSMDESVIQNAGSVGEYWSSSLGSKSNGGYTMRITSSKAEKWEMLRYYGLSVRPVCD